ncbi:MAG TPA: hypothetical protein VNB24_10245 [Acidimicrobiales bacterium]|nr:hypothetical protein [Acidimicrobiales bacterium]
MTAGLRATIALLTLGAAALLVAAYFRVASDSGTVVTSAGPRWDSAQVDGERTLVIGFVGGREAKKPEPCKPTYSALVSESPKEVVVTLRTHTLQKRAAVGCDDIGVRRSLDVTLASPLGGRTLRDGRTGETHAVGAGGG